MSHETFTSSAEEELNALRENLPTVVEEAAPSKSTPQIYYSADLAARILDDYVQGKSLHAISHKAEMPAYSTLLKWSKNHPEFSKMLRSVREARALHFEDLAIRTAERAEGKDADRLKVDTYIWAAEVNDPASYGKKVTHAGDASNPMVIQVVTGFGPPNKWQTPPKLREDGTIDKEYEAAQEVKAEVVSDPTGQGDPVSDDSAFRERQGSVEARPLDAPSDLSRELPNGAEALPAFQGHTPDSGSPQSPSVRGGEREVLSAEDPSALGTP